MIKILLFFITFNLVVYSATITTEQVTTSIPLGTEWKAVKMTSHVQNIIITRNFGEDVDIQFNYALLTIADPEAHMAMYRNDNFYVSCLNSSSGGITYEFTGTPNFDVSGNFRNVGVRRNGNRIQMDYERTMSQSNLGGTVTLNVNSHINIPWGGILKSDFNIPFKIFDNGSHSNTNFSVNIKVITLPKVTVADIDFGSLTINYSFDQTKTMTGDLEIMGMPNTSVSVSLENSSVELQQKNGNNIISGTANISLRGDKINSNGILHGELEVTLVGLSHVRQGVYEGSVVINVTYN